MRVVPVDLLEIGQAQGMLVLRMFRLDGQRAAQLALPGGQMASQLVDNFRHAALDAEEDFWQVLDAAQQRCGPAEDDDVVATEIERWLRRRDWDKVLTAAPGGYPPDGLALATHWGHVAVVAPRPFLDRWVVPLMCPLQLHRVATELKAAATAAAEEAEGYAMRWSTRAGGEAALEEVHRWLAGQPLPCSDVSAPTLEEAAETIERQRVSFLSRKPYRRADEHSFTVE